MNRLPQNIHLLLMNRYKIAATKLQRAIICESCVSRNVNLMKYSTVACNSKQLPSGAVQFRKIQHQPQYIGLGGYRSLSTSLVRFQQQDRDRERTDDEQEKPPDEQPDDQTSMLVVALVTLATVGAVFYYLNNTLMNQVLETIDVEISWNSFVQDMLSKGEVESITVYPDRESAVIRLHSGAIVKGKHVWRKLYLLKIGDPNKFENKVLTVEKELGIKPHQAVPINFVNKGNSLLPTLLFFFIGAICFLSIRSTFKKIKMDVFNPANMFQGIRKANFIRADLQPQQGITFKDVAGLHEAKVEIMEFVDYIRHPERFTKLGAKVPKGALLLGPPGCGKTLIAKALAAESNVPFLVMAGSEFVEMIGGLGASRMRDLFKEAREKAPCIIYIDEIDAIGRKRGGNNWSDNAEEEHTLNQLLVEMDGMSTKKGVILIASTNRADVLDKALLRPGRFDRHIMIDFPTLAERKELFDLYLRHLKLAKLPANYKDRLAQLSPGMTGADIANVCNEAALHAVRETRPNVDVPDFEYAVERMIAGVEKKTSILSGQEKKVVAYHEAGHALVGWLLEHTDPLLRVSIVPRTSYALGFAQYLPSDRKLQSKDELFERICMALGGRVAESLTFNSITSGAQNDLQQVTKIAYAQVRELGMNERIGQVSFPSSDDGNSTRPYSKYLTRLIDEESRNLVANAYKCTERLIQENEAKLKMIAEGLLEKEVLDYKDVEQLIGPPKYTKMDLPSV